MQLTAQAVGRNGKMTKPRRGERRCQRHEREGPDFSRAVKAPKSLRL